MNRIFLLLLIVILTVAGMFACGGQPAAENPVTAPAESAVPGMEPGEEDAFAAVDLRNKAIAELAQATANITDPAELKSKLLEIKERYILQIVEYGKKREALDEAGRQAFDQALLKAYNLSPREVFDTYMAACEPWRGDAEISAILDSFNNLQKYANFDSVRFQEPADAERLGIAAQ